MFKGIQSAYSDWFLENYSALKYFPVNRERGNSMNKVLHYLKRKEICKFFHWQFLQEKKSIKNFKSYVYLSETTVICRKIT